MLLECCNKEDLELVLDRDNGMVYASQSAIARMVNRPRDGSFRNFMARFETLSTEIPTSKGLRHGKLYNEDAIYEALSKYRPEILVKCAKAGIRVYLYKLVGADYSSSNNKIDSNNLSVQLIMKSLSDLHIKIDKQDKKIKDMESSCIKLNKIETVLDSYKGLKEALDYLISNKEKENSEFSLRQWLEVKGYHYIKRGDRVRLGRLVSSWVTISCGEKIEEKYKGGYKIYCSAFEPVLNLALDHVLNDCV